MSVTIPKELQDFIAGKMAWVATADSSGMPNLAPKGTLRLLDDHSLVFADIFAGKTRAALEQNPKASVAVVDFEHMKGYQFKGQVEILSSGPIYNEVAEGLKKAAPQLPVPKQIAKITVNAIYNLAPGPDAGKQIA